ncbi:MAG: oxygen-independent coproporphyrinogen III oxidase [Blautia sp.]|nr:oxygen-independent coproporphyrinogen III oxidase [Blautia sp.]
MAEDKSSGIAKVPLELYIHIPFCVKKCDYCDFLSAPADQRTQDAYFDALLEEIHSRDRSAEYEIISVFIGGGTPSVPAAGQIARVMQALREHFSFAGDAEITIEANPGTLTAEKLEIYKKSGINRLSLGLQSTDDRELKLLGRIHTYEDFLDSFRLAREAGFQNINADLISAIPEQTEESWIRNLRRVAELSPEHISAYSLIVEEGTPFAERELNLPDEDTEYQMYEDAHIVLSEYGYEQYEISNYAKPGFACRHNLGYWKRTPYLGLGLGAASFFEGYRFSNTRVLTEYLSDSACPDKIHRDVEPVSRQSAMEEFLFLGFRMTEGVSEQEFERQFGIPLQQKYGGFLKKYESSGHLERAGDFWRLTRRGIHVSNWILADVLEE